MAMAFFLIFNFPYMKNITLLVVSMVFVGCVSTSSPDSSKIVDIQFRLDNVGFLVQRGDDVLNIEEVRFLVEEFAAFSPSGQDSINTITPLAFFYTTGDVGLPRGILFVNAGALVTNTFQSARYIVRPANETDPFSINEFRIGEQLMTAVITGTYNGQGFRIGSQFNQIYNFTFPQFTLDNTFETARFTLEGDAGSWFIDQSSNTILSPFASANVAAIFQKMRDGLTINARAQDLTDN